VTFPGAPRRCRHRLRPERACLLLPVGSSQAPATKSRDSATKLYCRSSPGLGIVELISPLLGAVPEPAIPHQCGQCADTRDCEDVSSSLEAPTSTATVTEQRSVLRRRRVGVRNGRSTGADSHEGRRPDALTLVDLGIICRPFGAWGQGGAVFRGLCPRPAIVRPIRGCRGHRPRGPVAAVSPEGATGPLQSRVTPHQWRVSGGSCSCRLSPGSAHQTTKTGAGGGHLEPSSSRARPLALGALDERRQVLPYGFPNEADRWGP